jgi:excinuclease ABC subunit A
MVDRLMELPEGTRLYLLAPIVRGRKGEYKKEIADLRKQGFQRLKVDGTLYDIEEVPALNKKLKHDIEVVVDRLVIRSDLGHRLVDAIETVLRLSDGLLYGDNADTGERIHFQLSLCVLFLDFPLMRLSLVFSPLTVPLERVLGVMG